jgi:hypothetical protein
VAGEGRRAARWIAAMRDPRVLRFAAPAGVLAWSAWSLRDTLAPGLPLEFDAHSHVARAGFAAQALAEGRLPTFDFAWYGGWRLLEFYAPAWYVLVGALGLAAGDVFAATKGALFAVQLATALALHSFGRRLGLVPLAAALLALLFVESPQRGWLIGRVGNHPSVLVYAGAAAWLWLAAAAPAPGASLARLAAPRALVFAAMLLGHLQAALLAPGLVAFDAVNLAWRIGTARALTALAGALAGGVALTAFVWLPALADLGLVSLSLDAQAPPAPGLAPLLVAAGLEPHRWDIVFVVSHGAWLGLALAAAALGIARRHPAASALGVGLVAAAGAVAQLGERAIPGLGLLAWPLCALLPALVGRGQALLTLLLLAGVGLHVALGAHVAPLYAPRDELDVYAALPPTSTRSRTFDLTPRSLCLDGFYGSSSAAPLVSGRGVPLGAFPQGAPLAANLSTALLARLAHEAAPSEPSLDALYLAHVGFLVDRGPDRRLMRLRDASPALFAPRLATLASSLAPPAPDGELRLLRALRARWVDDPLDEGPRRAASLAPLARTGAKRDFEVVAPAVAAMRIDRRRAVAEQILVDGPAPPAEPASPDAALETAARLDVLGHRESVGAVEIDVSAPAAGWLRLAYAWDPRLELRLDGRPVRLARDSLGALLLAVPAGRSRIELRVEASAERALLPVSCGLLALLLAGVALAPRRGAP